jgi:hypothetical protein
MRITYRTLAKLIDRMSNEQKDLELTVDIWNGSDFETYGADFRIVNEKHQNLQKNHPVVLVDQVNDLGPLVSDIEWIARSIGITEDVVLPQDKTDTD